jgi:hypothetical protein
MEQATYRPETLPTPGLPFRLRRLRVEDADSLVRHGNNPKIAINLQDRFPKPYTRADGLSFIRVY